MSWAGGALCALLAGVGVLALLPQLLRTRRHPGGTSTGPTTDVPDPPVAQPANL